MKSGLQKKPSFRRETSDRSGKKKEIYVTEEEMEKHHLADSIDEEKEAKIKKLKEDANKDGLMWRTLMMNDPMYLLPIGLIAAVVKGAGNPVFSV